MGSIRKTIREKEIKTWLGVYIDTHNQRIRKSKENQKNLFFHNVENT